MNGQAGGWGTRLNSTSKKQKGLRAAESKKLFKKKFSKAVLFYFILGF